MGESRTLRPFLRKEGRLLRRAKHRVSERNSSTQAMNLPIPFSAPSSSPYTAQMNCETKGWTIDDLRDRFVTINLSPTYQRESNIWTLAQKKLLIDSILNGYDIPKFYIHKLAPGEPHKWAVADGKQRLTVIMEFIQNSNAQALAGFKFANPGFALAKDFSIDQSSTFAQAVLEVGKSSDLPAAGSTFSTFSQIAKNALLAYVFDVVEITLTDPIAEYYKILELYQRLNDGRPLSKIEKRYALLGSLNEYLQNVSTTNEFFVRRITATNKRYQHYDLATKLCLVASKSLDGGDGVGDLSDSVLRTLIKENESHDKAERVKIVYDSLLKSLNKTFQLNDTLLREPGRLAGYAAFVLHVERNFASPNNLYTDIRKTLQSVEAERPAAGTEKSTEGSQDQRITALRQYADALSQGTLSAKSLRKQVENLVKLMMIYIPTTVLKDPKRGFSDAQRCAIWNLSPHKCADCHTALNDLSEMHADHVVPHSKGGQTSVANGQPLCKQCNLKKSNSLK